MSDRLQQIRDAVARDVSNSEAAYADRAWLLQEYDRLCGVFSEGRNEIEQKVRRDYEDARVNLQAKVNAREETIRYLMDVLHAAFPGMDECAPPEAIGRKVAKRAQASTVYAVALHHELTVLHDAMRLCDGRTEPPYHKSTRCKVVTRRGPRRRCRCRSRSPPGRGRSSRRPCTSARSLAQAHVAPFREGLMLWISKGYSWEFSADWKQWTIGFNLYAGSVNVFLGCFRLGYNGSNSYRAKMKVYRDVVERAMVSGMGAMKVSYVEPEAMWAKPDSVHPKNS